MDSRQASSTPDGGQSASAALSAMRSLWYADERTCVAALAAAAELSAARRGRSDALAQELIGALRRPQRRSVEALTRQVALDSPAGLALLALAEALLRIPDAANADRLIADKLAGVDWRVAGASGTFALALQLASAVAALAHRAVRQSPSARLARLLAPPLRVAMRRSMRIVGAQFVFGESIEHALLRARPASPRSPRYSFDMLGEAALTAEDAQRYFAAYAHAIQAVGRAYRGLGPIAGGSVSVKLSALHPRYGDAQRERVCRELWPRLRELALLAARHDVALAIDAEEAERLELSLQLLESLLSDPALRGWGGLGVAVQAYQKRAPAVIDYLLLLAGRRAQRLMVRLVKGAYWDAEIKGAQMQGFEGYPLYTRKAHTDIAYLACARTLVSASAHILPQFATHNAQTVATILELAAACGAHELEFQRLFGMGGALYQQLSRRASGPPPVRVYAPVGEHVTLVPYLMRRLLENGAASSFVHRAAPGASSALELDPVQSAARAGFAPHAQIPPPHELYLPERYNSRGIDLAHEGQRRPLEEALVSSRRQPIEVRPRIARRAEDSLPRAAAQALGPRHKICNPADRRDWIGEYIEADAPRIEAALEAAHAAAPQWAERSIGERAELLERSAALLERELAPLVALAVREAGKTLADGVAEVREAVDYLRYYAARIRAEFEASVHRPLGPVVCISPWNFPLAIFTGQIAGALAAGNVVLAKPAEQTNAIAAHAVRLLHEAGIPDSALQLLPGDGERIAAQLLADARVRAVVFTGSVPAARSIARALARRDEVPLIAETGGQNALIVDSSALPEQVVSDVLRSAFDSAGQRCSALRVLCLQQEIASPVLEMLRGAMRELRVGDPARLDTDVGPLIDEEARTRIEAHLRRFEGRTRCRSPLSAECEHGVFLAPALLEIDNVAELKEEVFGPVLHVLRFERPRLASLLDAINATGYGLTLGIASRIDSTIAEIIERARVGNVYVNRNIIGAVVGTQPFGGRGLSGTGPKAGGPLYLHRLLQAGPGPQWPRERRAGPPPALLELIAWLSSSAASGALLDGGARAALVEAAERDAERTLLAARLPLPGYVGESNELTLRPCGRLRATARSLPALVRQVSAALATGNRLTIDEAGLAEALRDAWPRSLRGWLADGNAGREAVGAVLVDRAQALQESVWLARLRGELAADEGPIVPLVIASEAGYGLERLLAEQTVTVNTAAVGGDARLLSLPP